MTDWKRAPDYVDISADQHDQDIADDFEASLRVGARPSRWRIAVIASGYAAAFALSYGLALAGEPSSVWLWRDVLGLIN
jgi:hypothetical protein